MNIILIEDAGVQQVFYGRSRVYQHVRDVLKMEENDVFDVGQIDGPRGKARILRIDEQSLEVSILWGSRPESVRPVEMLLGLSRPQTVQKQLNVLATLGVSKMIFFPTDRGEPSYAKSRVWRDGLWRRHVLEGVEQAFATALSRVELTESLDEALKKVSEGPGARVVLDNYEAPQSLAHIRADCDSVQPVVLAVGSERGWTGPERNLFRECGYCFAHLGTRVLRCETAASLAAAAFLGNI